MIKNYLNTTLIFFLTGFVAAFLALVFSVLFFDFLDTLKDSKATILFGVLIEEIFRFSMLCFAIPLTIHTLKKIQWVFFLASGLGFASLEFFLILQNYSAITLEDLLISYLPAIFVHITNTLLLGYVIFFSGKIKFKKVFFLIFLIISVIIHLVFNMFANI